MTPAPASPPLLLGAQEQHLSHSQPHPRFLRGPSTLRSITLAHGSPYTCLPVTTLQIKLSWSHVPLGYPSPDSPSWPNLSKHLGSAPFTHSRPAALPLPEETPWDSTQPSSPFWTGRQPTRPSTHPPCTAFSCGPHAASPALPPDALQQHLHKHAAPRLALPPPEPPWECRHRHTSLRGWSASGVSQTQWLPDFTAV